MKGDWKWRDGNEEDWLSCLCIGHVSDARGGRDLRDQVRRLGLYPAGLRQSWRGFEQGIGMGTTGPWWLEEGPAGGRPWVRMEAAP